MVDNIVAAVADRTRRRVLGRLEPLAPERTLAVDTLLDGDPSADGLRLRHVHLPKLAEVGLVDWDPDAGRVGRGPDFARAVPLLRAVEEVERDAPGTGSGSAPADSTRAGRR